MEKGSQNEHIPPGERRGEREKEGGERIECKEKVKLGLSHGIIKRVPL